MPGPSPSAHQVLIYSGPGVSPLSLSHTLLTFSLLLLPHYTVQPITPQTLATQPWEPSCALLVIPGGRDLPYVEELSIKTKVTRRIRDFVHEGGRYLGICAGAYFGAAEVRFDTGGDMEVVGKRDLVRCLASGCSTTDHTWQRLSSQAYVPDRPSRASPTQQSLDPEQYHSSSIRLRPLLAHSTIYTTMVAATSCSHHQLLTLYEFSPDTQTDRLLLRRPHPNYPLPPF